MISRSLKNVFNKQQRITQATQQLIQMPSRSAGGGVKKPPMPATERDFDIVLVGKYKPFLLILNIISHLHLLFAYRWHERDCVDKVHADRGC